MKQNLEGVLRSTQRLSTLVVNIVLFAEAQKRGGKARKRRVNIYYILCTTWLRSDTCNVNQRLWMQALVLVAVVVVVQAAIIVSN